MSRNNNSSSGGGIGFTSLLAILFIALKLIGIIDWPWIWVLCPIWIGWAVIFILLAIWGLINRRK